MPHFLRRRPLDRRTFLRGAGAAVALPWLDAMTPALAGKAPGARTAPVRCAFVFAPNGMKMDDWTPAETGAGYRMPYLLEPLEPWRERVLVLSGLTLDGGRAHGDGPGDHARAAASFLTCAHPRKTGGADIHNGVSVDQVVARAVGPATPFPSLEIGMERGRAAGACDSGYSCAYSNNVSWQSATTPRAKETDPRAVFARLFGDPEGAAGARERRRRLGVLDVVRADARSLRGRLGTADRAKLDEYLEAVRSVEERLSRAETGRDEVAAPEGLGEPGGFPARLDLMYELIALAFTADLTRVVTFMLGNAGSNRSYRFLDVAQGHHSLSHHRGSKDKIARIRKIDRWHLERFAAFVDRLDGAAEGEQSLLDSSMVLLGSGLSDGNRHRHEDLPVLVAGTGNGSVRGGRHLRSPDETPMANLYLALMDRMQVRADSFADSTGRLEL